MPARLIRLHDQRLWWAAIATLIAAVSALAYPWLLVVVVAPGGIALAALRPDIMLGVLAASIPVQSAGSIQILDVNLTVTKLCLACLVIGWSFRLEGAQVPLDGIAWLYGSVNLALGVSLIATQDTGAWASAIYQWMVCLIVFFIARTEIRSLSAMHAVVAGMAFGVLGVSTCALVQVALADGPPSFVVDGRLRAYGTFGEPNPLAAYLELTLPVLIAVAVFGFTIGKRGKRSARWNRSPAILAIPVIFGIAALVLTQSRGGLVGFSGAMIALVFFLSCRQQWIVVTLVGALGLAVAFSPARDLFLGRFMPLLDEQSGRTLVTKANWAAEERRAHWGAAWNMLIAHPWTGVGAGDFSTEFRTYTPEWRFLISRGHAHNGYLHLGGVAGVFGLVSFASFTGTSVLTVFRSAIVEREPQLRAIRAGCFAIVIAFAVHSLVDYLNVLSLGIQLALILAIGISDGGSSRPNEGSTLRISPQMTNQ